MSKGTSRQNTNCDSNLRGEINRKPKFQFIEMKAKKLSFDEGTIGFDGKLFDKTASGLLPIVLKNWLKNKS